MNQVIKEKYDEIFHTQKNCKYKFIPPQVVTWFTDCKLNFLPALKEDKLTMEICRVKMIMCRFLFDCNAQHRAVSLKCIPTVTTLPLCNRLKGIHRDCEYGHVIFFLYKI